MRGKGSRDDPFLIDTEADFQLWWERRNEGWIWRIRGEVGQAGLVLNEPAFWVRMSPRQRYLQLCLMDHIIKRLRKRDKRRKAE